MINDTVECLKKWWSTSCGIERWYAAIIFLVPTMTMVHQSGSSVAYTLLLLPSLFLLRGGWTETSRAEKQIIITMGLLFISACISLYISDSFDEGIKRLERFFRLFSIAFLIMALRRYRLRLGMVLMYGVIFSLPFIFAHAAYQLTSGVEQAGRTLYGTFYGIFYGDYLVLTLGLLSAYAASIVLSHKQLAALVAAALGVLSLTLLSGTRGAWLFLPVIPLIYFLFFGIRREGNKYLRLGIVAFVLIAVIAALNTPQVTQRIDEAYQDIQAYMDNPARTNSIGARLAMWTASIDIWREHPLFGTGLGDFNKEIVDRYQDGRIKSHIVKVFTQAHSIYFHSLAMLGSVGFLLVMLALIMLPLRAFIASVVMRERSRNNFYALAGIVIISAYAVFGLTETWYTRNPFVNVFVIYTAVLLTSLPKREDKA